MGIVRWFVGTCVSRIYLALVATITTYVVVSESIEVAGSGATDSMPEIILLPLSMPGVLLTLPVINTMQDPWWLSLVLCVAAGALINAAGINGLAALLRRFRARRDEPRTPAVKVIR
ncbi:SCO4225 family membrane protein [Actinoplanes flavus]|uniref:LrgA family protein n=1 Tax=Actinoplanes flavus TaxID=2820290 RepID=A0ABS3UIG6_9ACTN|nr:hypothetical protein [Actinoplanes flavus]MBO3738578.1 hypothetical protein [Actinoplanes flavus]